MFVVTMEVNDYDQRGGYFVGLFDTYDDALKEFKKFGRYTPKDQYDKWEQEWYECYEVNSGDTFIENIDGNLVPDLVRTDTKKENK